MRAHPLLKQKKRGKRKEKKMGEGKGERGCTGIFEN